MQGLADIEWWATRLDDLGIERSAILEAKIGWIMTFDDPDGMQLRFYTAEGPHTR